MPGSLTTPGRTDARTNASVHVVFRKTEHVDTRDFQAFAAQWLAYVLPYRRFAVILADANARLGANADCYSFIAADFHHLLFAGFYRRTGFLALFRNDSDLHLAFLDVEDRIGRVSL
jgi:hypothetical protein